MTIYWTTTLGVKLLPCVVHVEVESGSGVPTLRGARAIVISSLRELENETRPQGVTVQVGTALGLLLKRQRLCLGY